MMYTAFSIELQVCTLLWVWKKLILVCRYVLSSFWEIFSVTNFHLVFGILQKSKLQSFQNSKMQKLAVTLKCLGMISPITDFYLLKQIINQGWIQLEPFISFYWLAMCTPLASVDRNRHYDIMPDLKPSLYLLNGTYNISKLIYSLETFAIH